MNRLFRITPIFAIAISSIAFADTTSTPSTKTALKVSKPALTVAGIPTDSMDKGDTITEKKLDHLLTMYNNLQNQVDNSENAKLLEKELAAEKQKNADLQKKLDGKPVAATLPRTIADKVATAVKQHTITIGMTVEQANDSLGVIGVKVPSLILGTDSTYVWEVNGKRIEAGVRDDGIIVNHMVSGFNQGGFKVTDIPAQPTTQPATSQPTTKP